MAHEHEPGEIRTDGRCFTYVLPCAWEDFCKIGFSRNPLSRLRSLHPRWFEFFDLDTGTLVETETERDARDLELELRRPLKAHRAPAPLTIAANAGGKTEWVRGANAQLAAAARALATRGFRVYPLRPWARAATLQRVDLLYDWSSAQLPLGEHESTGSLTPAQQALRDTLDSHAALGIELRTHLPEHVWDWYQRN
ncbi:MAG TPA: GIY-YIG nuclease family protein [Stenotrophomonas sp.]|nr:GIY-YIG nuclease family protein [Stenotrophomonas sp.]